MGKNKWYSDFENSVKQPGSATTHNNPRGSKKTSYMPSSFVWESPENMPLPKLMRLVWLRLRRSWIALRFQANRWSFGLFKFNTAIKLGLLAGAGFVLLGPDGESGLLNRGEHANISWARETNLAVGGDSDLPRKIKVPKRKNEAAPVSSKELVGDQTMNYIQRYSKIAIGEMNQYGIPASISLAQGLIESRAGTSTLAVTNNNHFGMKCFLHNCKKGHCSNFTDDSHKDFFRKFPSAWESWRAHSIMISTGRYAKLKRYGRDYNAWARGLKSVGYATDGTYADKLIGIIERYELYKYDR